MLKATKSSVLLDWCPPSPHPQVHTIRKERSQTFQPCVSPSSASSSELKRNFGPDPFPWEFYLSCIRVKKITSCVFSSASVGVNRGWVGGWGGVGLGGLCIYPQVIVTVEGSMGIVTMELQGKQTPCSSSAGQPAVKGPQNAKLRG